MMEVKDSFLDRPKVDKYTKQFDKHTPQQLIRQYAVHSYLYYQCDTNVVTDQHYDALARAISIRFEEIKPYDTSGYIWDDPCDFSSGNEQSFNVCGKTKRLADLVLYASENGYGEQSYAFIENEAFRLMKIEDKAWAKRREFVFEPKENYINTKKRIPKNHVFETVIVNLVEKAKSTKKTQLKVEDMTKKSTEESKNHILNVEEIEHSKLGASSADRWMHCPASIRLIDNLPPEAFEASEPAAEGTAAHELAALCLQTKSDAWEHAGKIYKVSKYEFEVNQNMIEAVQGYLDFVWGIMAKYDDAILHVERSLSSFLHDLAFGTADITIEVPSKRLMIIVDYKHGRHVVCEPEGSQTRYYGYLALENSDYDDFNTVELWIYQPRHYHPKGSARNYNIGAEELTDWFTNECVPAMDATNDPESLFGIGDWCRFCPAKHDCPALRKEMTEFQIDLPVGSLTGDELGALLDTGDKIKKYLDALTKEAYRRIMQGTAVKGRKLVNKKSNRTWKHEKTVDGESVELDIEKLLKKQFGDDAYQPKNIKTPPNIEILPEGKGFVKKYAYKPQTGLTMAAITDKRIEVKPLIDKFMKQ